MIAPPQLVSNRAVSSWAVLIFVRAVIVVIDGLDSSSGYHSATMPTNCRLVSNQFDLIVMDAIAIYMFRKSVI